MRVSEAPDGRKSIFQYELKGIQGLAGQVHHAIRASHLIIYFSSFTLIITRSQSSSDFLALMQKYCHKWLKNLSLCLPQDSSEEVGGNRKHILYSLFAKIYTFVKFSEFCLCLFSNSLLSLKGSKKSLWELHLNLGVSMYKSITKHICLYLKTNTSWFLCPETFVNFCGILVAPFHWKFIRIMSEGMHPRPWCVMKLYIYMVEIIAQRNSPAVNAGNDNHQAVNGSPFLSDMLTSSTVYQRLVFFLKRHMSLQTMLYSGSIHVS